MPVITCKNEFYQNSFCPFNSSCIYTNCIHTYPETAIVDMQSADLWTKGTQGVKADNTTDYIKGTQCVTLASNSASEAHIDIKNLNLDFTGKQIIIYLKFNNIANLISASGYAQVIFGSDNDFTFNNSYKFTVSSLKLAAGQLTTDASNIWYRLTFHMDEGVVNAGSPNWASIKSIRWQMDDNNVGTVMYCQGVYTQHLPPYGIVTFTFDDSYDNQYLSAYPILQANGLKGTFYTIESSLGHVGYCTLAQVKEMANNGMDIAGHHVSNFTTLDPSTLDSVFSGIKNFLFSNGFSGYNHIAYPNGAWDEVYVLPTIKRYFKYGRTVCSNFAETYPPSYPYKLRVYSMVKTTTPATIATWVDKAKTNKEHLILVFHKIGSTGETTTVTEADFTTMVQYVAASGVKVATMTEVYG